MAGEESVSVREFRARTALKLHSLRRAQFEVSDVGPAGRPQLRFPLEAFQHPVPFRHLDYRGGVVLGIVEIIYPLHIPVLESGGEHFGLDLVDGGDGIVLLEIEYGRDSSESVEAAQLRVRVEIGHHLRTPDLVEEDTVLLHSYKSIGHQARPVHAVAFHQHEKTVRAVLPPAFVPDERLLVEARDRVQFAEAHRVAAHLDVPPEYLHIAYSLQETHS